MSRTHDLAKNTAIIAVGKMATQLLTFILLPIYTFILTPKAYGQVDLILTYALLFAPLATLQIERATFRHLIDARKDSRKSSIIITNSLITISLSTIFLATVLIVANKIHVIPLFWPAFGVFTVTIYSNLFQQVARGQGKNKIFSIGSVITGVSQIIAALILVLWLRYGAVGILTSSIISNMAGIAYFVYALRLWKYIDINQFSRKEAKQQLSYSIPLVPSNIAWWVINVSDRTIVTYFLGSAANGVYAVAVKLSSILSVLYGIYDMSWTEATSLHIHAEDRDQLFSKIMDQSLRFFGSVGLLLITSFGVVFPLIISHSFYKAYGYIPILVVAALFNAVVSQYSAIYIAVKQTKKVANSSIGSAIINLVMTVIGVQYYGVYAAAIATAMAFAVMTIYRHFETRKYVRITYLKSTINIMIIMYTVTFILYYIHSIPINAALLCVSIIVALYLNRPLIGGGYSALRQRIAKRPITEIGK